MVKKLAKLGLLTSVSGIAIGSLPSSAITQNVGAGFETFSTSFPIIGKLKGTELVLKQTGRLIKTARSLKPPRKKSKKFKLT